MPDLFGGDHDDDTREAILRATYRALCIHGYADLTIQRIGDEFPKSKSLLYHHYDGKDDLLVEFLESMLERFEASVPVEEEADAATQLRTVLAYTFPATLGEERRQFMSAMTELRAQAVHDDAYRDHFTRSDRYFHDRLRGIVAAGVASGTFREVDPDEATAFLLTLVQGAMARRVTADDEALVRAARAEVDRYVEDCLLPE